jgi:hypothetical protein
VTPDATAVTGATPALMAHRADGTTALDSSAGTAARCFIAPADETALLHVTQADGASRSYRLTVVETTLWADWFFIGGDYASYTMLRNTTAAPVAATITWRSLAGDVIGAEMVTLPASGVIFRDAREATSGGTPAGSVEIAHSGEPQALAGSQTTLSATTGLSFDTVLAQRRPR